MPHQDHELDVRDGRRGGVCIAFRAPLDQETDAVTTMHSGQAAGCRVHRTAPLPSHAQCLNAPFDHVIRADETETDGGNGAQQPSDGGHVITLPPRPTRGRRFPRSSGCMLGGGGGVEMELPSRVHTHPHEHVVTHTHPHAHPAAPPAGADTTAGVLRSFNNSL